MALTNALVQRHGLGRRDTFGAALLDIAQDHVLWLLTDAGLLDGTEAVLKGGTSLRKCRLGTNGRFSTDLDFAVPSDNRVLEITEAIDGALISGFAFKLLSSSADARHWELSVTHEEFGTPDVPSSVEFARRPLALPSQNLPFVPLAVHKSYEISLPSAIPVVAAMEACAEKLARYRRASLGRDLYDLNYFSGLPMDEKLVRRLWVLKVWSDINDDGRGVGPIDTDHMLRVRPPSEFEPESTGKLTTPVEIDVWEARVRQRFGFLALLDADETRWAECNLRHRHEVQTALGAADRF